MSHRLLGNEIRVIYQKSLDDTDDFSTATDTVGWSWAVGASGTTAIDAYHIARGGYVEVNLETGAVVVVDEDMSLETAHGVIMFIAWSVFCAAGTVRLDNEWFESIIAIYSAVVLLFFSTFYLR